MPQRADPMALAALPERRDVIPSRIYLAGLGLLVLLIVALGVLWLFYGSTSSGPAIGLARLDPAAELATFNAHEDAELKALGWIDRSKGVVRIPVADAMTVIAQRGKLPEWSAASPSDVECGVLESAAPRSPQAVDCTMGWRQWLRSAP